MSGRRTFRDLAEGISAEDEAVTSELDPAREDAFRFGWTGVAAEHARAGRARVLRRTDGEDGVRVVYYAAFLAGVQRHR